MSKRAEISPKGFDEFWATYPRRVEKLAAQRAYVRARGNATEEQILHGAQKYAHERAGKDRVYTKHPATWLNAGCWMDYDPAPEAPKNMHASLPAMLGVYVSFAERDAWDAYGRKIGKSYPRDRAGGWWFPSREPPQ